MSTTSSPLPRAYIGARRNRQYINNHLPSPAGSQLYSRQLNQSAEPSDLLNAETKDTLQAQQEEQASAEHLSPSSSVDERQLRQHQTQKAKGISPPTSPPFCLSSSLSPFLFPTTYDVPPLSYSSHSSPSFSTEQQHHPSHRHEPPSYRQPLSSENKNNQLLLLEEHQPHKEEQQQRKQSPTNSLSVYNQNVLELSNIPAEKNSFSPPCSLSDTTVEHHDNDHQSQRFTPTSLLSPLASYRPTANNHNPPSLSTEENKNSTSLPLASDSSLPQPSTLLADHSSNSSLPAVQEKTFNSMSSFRHSSLTAHPYDQRISDQGNKYIIQLKTDEYHYNEFVITPRVALNQIVIDAKHREEDTTGGYVHRELHKIFIVPKHIDLDHFAYTYNKHTQELTVEMPYLPSPPTANENRNEPSFVHSSIRHGAEPLLYSSENRTRTTDGTAYPPTSVRSDYSTPRNDINGLGMAATDSTLFKSSQAPGAATRESPVGTGKPFDFDLFHRSPFRPQIIGASTNDSKTKKLFMSLDLSGYQADEIKVTVKDRDLVVKAERQIESGTRKSRSSFFQSTSLPPQTNIERLETHFADGRLTIEAPYLEQNNADRRTKSTSSSNNQGSNW